MFVAHQFPRFFASFFILGLIILGIAGILYFQAVGQTYSVKPDLSGFAIARNETNVSPQSLTMCLNVDPPEFSFDYTCEFNKTGTYDFVFVFPFYIKTMLSGYSSMIGNSGYKDMTFNATDRGSAVWCNYTYDNASFMIPDIAGVFSIEKTFESGSKGSYTVIFPFDAGSGGIPSSVVAEPFKEFGMNSFQPIGMRYITLQVCDLPSDCIVTNSFPQIDRGPVTGNSLSLFGNFPTTYVEWQLDTIVNTVRSVTVTNFQSQEMIYSASLLDSVILNYNDQAAIDHFTIYLFVSGIVFGIGSSVVVTTVYDALKERHQQSKDHT